MQTVPGGIRGLVASRATGQRLYVSERGAIDVIDAPTMTVRASIALGAKATAATLAISPDGTRAVVGLAGNRVGVVDLVRFRLSRRVKLAGVTGAAFAATGSNAYVATQARTGSRLVRLNTETGRVTRRIGLGKGRRRCRPDRRRLVRGRSRDGDRDRRRPVAVGQARARPYRARPRPPGRVA